MDKQILNQLKEKLEKEKARLEAELSTFAKKDPNFQHDWDSRYPRVQEGNIEEAADEVEEYSTRLPIEFALETRLKNVNEAIEKIEKGDYGICEHCRKEIDAKRLMVSPEAKFCEECMQKRVS
ncbi:MAG: TraR/DksA C4-type zinc finger protein [Candidatus Wildermuthbacteria bacterium]|nr:TraR/DksA C4-type zinc finger protein [Candidatus Wildermuthbacteria bacterium]